MKYAVVLGDGMADYSLEYLGGKTPLQAAYKPNIDKLAKHSYLGIVRTVPKGMKPGSDVANLSAMGFNPLECYTGRSPLEAVSMGIKLEDGDIALRCNLVTLSDEKNYSDKTMVDYCSNEISSQEAAEIIKTINEHFQNDIIKFYNGVSYRHCMVWQGGKTGLELTPPHDISDRKITDYIPKDKTILELMTKSYDILKNHTVNLERIKRGLNPANSIWLWGEGTRPSIPSFFDTRCKKGSVISAVDLVKGIGIAAGMRSIDVEGATGNIDTNFDGKCQAAIDEFKSGQDFVYIHVEAPDECGHRGEIDNKVKSINLIDEKIVGPLLDYFESCGDDYAILIMPDHPTPISLKTHVADPVPYMIYKKGLQGNGIDHFDEESCKLTGQFIDDGYKIIDKLFSL